MKRLVILCLAFLLAACGSAASQSVGTSSPTGGADRIPVSGFKATVSGAVSGDFSGTGSPFKQSGGGILISLIGTQGRTGLEINIILPAGTTAGTYTPKSYADAYDSTNNKITAVGATFSIRNATNGIDSYSIISEGILTLESVDPVTGSIHFKAKLEGGGEVDVSATFYQLIPV
ncbi:MAG: hypothetical protein GC179_07060 [Anaerolineaceae bacterium]|nr:hypothetical protein [Anaerolineaceae bacterium]